MFDIQNYNIWLAFLMFLFFFILIFFLFRSRIIAIIDPLIMHILWLSANLSFLFVFYVKYGLNIFLIIFTITFIFYIALLYKLLIPISKRKRIQLDFFPKIKISKILFLYFIITTLLIYSNLSLFKYLATHSLVEWPLYRFIELQGRDVMERIVKIGSSYLFIYFTFLFLFILKKYQTLALSLLIGYITVNLISGARTTILSVIFSFGAFLLFYKDFFNFSKIKKINILGYFFIGISIFAAMIVSSMYKNDFNFKDGVNIILNRVIASADGLEYYMLYNGYDNIQSGYTSYLLSIFGIYVKRLLEIEYKNIGHQLSELAISSNLDFAQGSNYTLPLQIMVLGYYTLPLYVLFAAYLVAKFRNITPRGSVARQVVSFFFISNSFFIVYDPEYGVLSIISFFLVYTVFIYPILKINFNFLNQKKVV